MQSTNGRYDDAHTDGYRWIETPGVCLGFGLLKAIEAFLIKLRLLEDALLFLQVFSVPGPVHHTDAGVVFQFLAMSVKELPEQAVKRASRFAMGFAMLVMTSGAVITHFVDIVCR